MTFGKWYRLFKHYQANYDMKVKGISYEDLRKQQKKRDEWL